MRRERPVVISDEKLYSLNLISLSARRLHDVFPDATILFSIRNQFSALQSLYLDTGRFLFIGTDRSQDRRRGMRTMSFEKFVERFTFETDSTLSNAVQRNQFQYHRGIEIYARYIGKDNIKLILYEDLVSDPSVWERQFVEMGVTLNDFGDLAQSKVNTADSLRATRYWNVRSRIPVKSFRNLLRLSEEQVAWAKKLLSGGNKDLTYSKAMRDRVTEIWGPGNRALAKNWGQSLGLYEYPM